jgi:hypothetical protein
VFISKGVRELTLSGEGLDEDLHFYFCLMDEWKFRRV